MRGARLKAALVQHARVVSALMLRDIKTRFGATYFGFVAGLMIPLAHVGIILSVYVLLGRRAPIGTDVTLYLTTAILPFVIWSYTHQKIIQSFGQNKVLTSFPIVKLPDIMISRALVELLASALVAVVVAVTLTIIGYDLFIFDKARFLYALFLAHSLGVSTGFIFGILSIIWPFLIIVGFVTIPLYWVTSGVLFIPDAVPEQIRVAVSVFPLSHIVDYARTAFYASYLSDYANLLYVNLIIIANLLTGLTIERFLRPILTQK